MGRGKLKCTQLWTNDMISFHIWNLSSEPPFCQRSDGISDNDSAVFRCCSRPTGALNLHQTLQFANSHVNRGMAMVRFRGYPGSLSRPHDPVANYGCRLRMSRLCWLLLKGHG